MAKLDLTAALAMKNSSGSIQALKGSGFSWQKPLGLDGFPALSFPESSFIYFDARDATATTWTARHGLPLTLTAVGSPTFQAINGIDCVTGAYDAIREPWPAETPFSIWLLTQNTSNYKVRLYNGPELYTNGSTALSFATVRAVVEAGNKYRKFNTVNDTGLMSSYQWDRNGEVPLSQIEAFQDNGLLTQYSLDDRGTSAAGERFVVGGEPDELGAVVECLQPIAGVLLTIGGILSADDRSALHSWWQGRLT